MPIYEYACKNCECNLEIFQGINDAPISVCPECNQPALVKLVSAAGFRLKGAGWYETDFKKEGDKKKNLVNDGEASSVVNTASAKSQDAAPAAANSAAGTESSHSPSTSTSSATTTVSTPEASK